MSSSQARAALTSAVKDMEPRLLEVCSVSHCSVGRLRPAERGDSGASGRRHTIASSYARHCVLYLSVQRHYPCMLCWGFPRVIQRTVLTPWTALPSSFIRINEEEDVGGSGQNSASVHDLPVIYDQ